MQRDVSVDAGKRYNAGAQPWMTESPLRKTVPTFRRAKHALRTSGVGGGAYAHRRGRQA